MKKIFTLLPVLALSACLASNSNNTISGGLANTVNSALNTVNAAQGLANNVAGLSDGANLANIATDMLGLNGQGLGIGQILNTILNLYAPNFGTEQIVGAALPALLGNTNQFGTNEVAQGVNMLCQLQNVPGCATAGNAQVLQQGLGLINAIGAAQ